MLRTIILSSLVLIGFSCLAHADTVYLKSGKVIEGKIVKETEDFIKLKTSGFLLTYFKDTIKKIDREQSPDLLSETTEGDNERPKKPKIEDGVPQKEFFMRAYDDSSLSMLLPAVWEKLDRNLYPFDSFADRVIRVFSHKAAYDVGFVVVGQKSRPSTPMSYGEILAYVVEELGKASFHSRPSVVYLSGERVVTFVRKAKYNDKSILINGIVFFRGKNWKTVEIAFEEKDFLAYGHALKKMRNSIRLR